MLRNFLMKKNAPPYDTPYLAVITGQMKPVSRISFKIFWTSLKLIQGRNQVQSFGQCTLY